MLKDIVKKPLFIPLAIVVAAAVVFLLLISQRGRMSAKPVEEQSWRVNVMIAKPGRYTPDILVHGVTESPNMSVLEAAIDADVIKTLAYEGYHVKKDQILIELDNREATYVLNQRKAEIQDLEGQVIREKNRIKSDRESLEHEKKVVKLAKRAVERELELQRRKLGTQANIDEKERMLWLQSLVLRTRQLAIANHPARLAELNAKLTRAKALYNRAELDLSRSTIKAPFDGYVSKLQVAVGNRVSPGDKLIELYDSQNIEVRAQIPSTYLPVVHQALSRQEKLTATALLDQQKMQLVLDRLSSAVPRGRGGVDGLFKIAKYSGHMALGRSLQVKLLLPSVEHAYSIPFSALYGDNRIYLAVEGRMRVSTVERVGLIHAALGKEEVIIKAQKLKAGDLIITTQLPNARDGLKIDIQDEK